MYISIEGNIGAGKSSIFEKLKEKLWCRKDYFFFPEPIDKFTKLGDYNPLQLAYENSERYGALTQIYIMKTSFNHYPNKNNTFPTDSVIISDRDYSSPVKFIHRDHLTGLYDPYIRNMLLKEFFDDYVQMFEPMQIDRTIFIDVSPEICFDRIQERGRMEEKNCTIDLLKSMDKVYKEVIDENPSHFIVINGNYFNPDVIAENIINLLEL